MEKKSRAGEQIRGTLGEPPADLVKVIASRETCLWAGAGLSAQSGFPLRADFIATTLQTAALESWTDYGSVQKLVALLKSGKAEQALDQLIAAVPERGSVLSHYTSIYARFAPPSRSHEHLQRMGFRSAITTNYDILLEQTDELWARNVSTLDAGPRKGRVLLKLFGSLRTPAATLLSSAELKKALHGPGLDQVRKLFADHPMLFVGCSLEGLLADLALLGIPEQSGHLRFAVAGVSGTLWEKQVEELSRRYGIQVVFCAAENIGRELPAFLERLAQSAGEMQQPAPDLDTKTAESAP